jgi:hypothetical protein
MLFKKLVDKTAMKLGIKLREEVKKWILERTRGEEWRSDAPTATNF